MFNHDGFGHWLVIYTNAGQEMYAFGKLVAQHYEVFMPLCRLVTGRLAREPLPRPLFPRYLFVKVGPGQKWTPITNTRGVDHILMAAPECHAKVPERVIVELRRRMERDGGAVAITDFEEGSPVRITGGPFQDFEGLYVRSGRDRVTVMLALLGTRTEVMVPRNLVAGR